MTARLVGTRSGQSEEAEPLTLTFDGIPYSGILGQTIAGVLLAADRVSWRTTSAYGHPRGVFCGIGVCFDCLVTVNGERDVRACLRRAAPGDVVMRQHDVLPGHVGEVP